MKFFKKILLSIWFMSTFVCLFAFADDWLDSEDLLNQAFKYSVEADQVVWQGLVWNTKEWVWNFLLRWWTEISSDGVSRKDSFVVALGKFLLRFTLIIAITMIIYNWIMFVVKSSKWEASKDTLKNIAYIIVWVLLALMSIVIIRLASSVGTTSLKMSENLQSENIRI